jgi:hypothetical protein
VQGRDRLVVGFQRGPGGTLVEPGGVFSR